MFKQIQTNEVLLFRFQIKDFKLSQLQNIRRMDFPLNNHGDTEEEANKQKNVKVTTTMWRFLHDIDSVGLWGPQPNPEMCVRADRQKQRELLSLLFSIIVLVLLRRSLSILRMCSKK